MRTEKKAWIGRKTKQKKISPGIDIQRTSSPKSVSNSVFWLADQESVKLCSVTVLSNKIISSRAPKGARRTIRLFSTGLTVKPELKVKILQVNTAKSCFHKHLYSLLSLLCPYNSTFSFFFFFNSKMIAITQLTTENSNFDLLFTPLSFNKGNDSDIGQMYVLEFYHLFLLTMLQMSSG